MEDDGIFTYPLLIYLGEVEEERKVMISKLLDRLMTKVEKFKGVAADHLNESLLPVQTQGQIERSESPANITGRTLESFKPFENDGSSDGNPTPTPGMFSHTPVVMMNEGPDAKKVVASLERIAESEIMIDEMGEMKAMEMEKEPKLSEPIDNFTNTILNPMYTMNISALSSEPSIDVYHSVDDTLEGESRNLIRSSSSRLFQQALEKVPNGAVVENEENAAFTEIEEAIIHKRSLGWAANDSTICCLRCSQKFGPVLRRHHCRWCGQIFCDGCSRARVTGLCTEKGESKLERIWQVANMVLSILNILIIILSISCFDLWKLSGYMIDSSTSTSDKLLGHVLLDKVYALSRNQRDNSVTDYSHNETVSSLELGGVETTSASAIPFVGPRSPDQGESGSECPICSNQFPATATDREVEKHVESCLQQAMLSSSHPIGNRYLIRTLNESIPDKECEICYETFDAGQVVAVLNCLCQFHEDCIAQWFFRGRSECPIHRQ